MDSGGVKRRHHGKKQFEAAVADAGIEPVELAGADPHNGVYAGTYGESAIFEVEEKTFMRIFMEIKAGI